MTKISQAQLSREAAEIALWQMPCPEPDAATRSLLSQFDSGSNLQAVGNKAVGDSSVLPDLGPLSSFSSWESVAATIMHKAVAISGFDPSSTVFDQNAWQNYLTKFSTMPFFLSYTYDYRHASISSTSLDQGVNAVSDLIQNIMTDQAYKGVVESIRKVGQLAMTSKGQQETNSNQQVGLLSRNANQLYLGVVRTVATMQTKSKGYEQLQQTIDVYRGYGVLDFDKCKRSSTQLLAWDGQDVDAWGNGTASASMPPNESPAWNH